MAEGIHSRLVPAHGDALAVRDWPLPAGVAPRGVVLLVHGLGEHVGRYAHVAGRLNAWGFAVRGYDQHGHGQSAGARGALPDDDRLLSDLAAVIDDTHQHMGPRRPLILLGHSMGGLVAARAVSLGLRPVEGLVLSSPALDAGMGAPLRALVQVLAALAPGLRLGNGIDAGRLTHDAAEVQAYRDDPRVHDRISARLARFIMRASPAVIEAAPRWTVPTLLLYAGQDAAVRPAGSAAFARAAPAGRVVAQAFPQHFHELFNERDRACVFRALGDWLTARWAPVDQARQKIR